MNQITNLTKNTPHKEQTALSTLIEKPYDFTKKQKSDFTKSTPHKGQTALPALIDNPYDFTKSKPHKEPP